MPMSNVAIPTKPGGERPPTVPPANTTFDGMPSDDGESSIAWLSENVRRTIRAADAASGEDIETMLGLVEQRRRWIEGELNWIGLLEDHSLPPFEGFSLDHLVVRNTREEKTLLSLIAQLDDCRARCERRLSRFQSDMRLSNLLDASDS
jgi:hypothetical protein